MPAAQVGHHKNGFDSGLDGFFKSIEEAFVRQAKFTEVYFAGHQVDTTGEHSFYALDKG